MLRVFKDRIVAGIKWVDGTLIDVVRQVGTGIAEFG